MNFSFCIIAKNEEMTLPRMINSLKDYQNLGGEIIVCDTGSTDNTVKIARELGCKIEEVGDKFLVLVDKELADKINEKFVVGDEAPVVKEGDSIFDFSSARNYIADFASNDFIFTPDCDEVWTNFNIDKIEESINNGAEQLEYNFVFSHDSLGNAVIKFMHSKAYNRKKLKWVGIIHEVLSGDAKKVYLDESIIKLEHYQNVETNRSGYIKGLAVDCFNNPSNDRNSHYFSREMMYTGRFNSAIKEFKRHIAMDKWAQENAQSMIYLGDCYLSLGDCSEAFKWWSKAIDKCPDKREPMMRFAEYYWKRARPEQVILYAEMALLIKQVPFYSNYQPYYEHYPHELLYWAYWYTGDKEKSKEHYEKAVSFCPHNPKYLFDRKFYCPDAQLPSISIIIPTLNREEGLNRCLDSIKELNYPRELIQTIVSSGEGTVPMKVKQMLDAATGEYICYASDDMEFTPDSLLFAIEESRALGKGLVSFNSGALLPDEGNICEHFIINRELVDKIGGEIFDTEFHHVGVDNLLWAKCKKLEESHHSDKAIIIHHHFSKGAEMDDTYREGWKEVEKDRGLLKIKLMNV